MNMVDFVGEWDCVTDTPMGEQTSLFAIRPEGDGFAGTNAGTMGSLDVIDGRIEDRRLIWKMKLTSPFPMTLDCQAMIEGDRLEGSVTAGAFGSWRMRGVRRG
jgi:hypothetical protein